MLDESTNNNKVKEQYDGHVSCWSPRYDQAVSAYAGSLSVGHCNPGNLVEHYNHFVDKLEIKSDYFRHLGMDGPNVNLSFENKPESNLEIINTSFLRIVTSSLYPTHTAFRKGIKSLYSNTINISGENKSTFDLDDFFKDLHFFSLNCLVQGGRTVLLLKMLRM